LWIGFGSGKAYKGIPIHEVALQMLPEKCIPFFHVFTNSSVLGIGKKSAWTAWTSVSAVTETMISLTESPSN